MDRAYQLAMRLPPHLRLLQRTLMREDRHTRMWMVRVQAGAPVWDWTPALVAYELQPCDRVLADQFCARMQRWQQVQHQNVLQLFDVIAEPPLALVESHWSSCTLAALLAGLRATGRTMPTAVAEWIGGQLLAGMRALHRHGVAHGMWAEHVLIFRDELKLAPYGWLDDRASLADDERCAASLASALVDLAEPTTEAVAPALHRLIGDVCPPPQLHWD